MLFWGAAALLLFGEMMILRAWWAGRTPAGNTLRARAWDFVWMMLPAAALAATLVVTWKVRASESSERIPVPVSHAERAS
jgi:hypothetical protein